MDVETIENDDEELEDDEFPEEDWFPEAQRPGGWLSGTLLNVCAPRRGNLLWWILRRPLLLTMNDYLMGLVAAILAYGAATADSVFIGGAALMAQFQILGSFVLAADLPRRLGRSGLAAQLYVSPMDPGHFEGTLRSVLESCLWYMSILIFFFFAGGVGREAVRRFYGVDFGPDQLFGFVMTAGLLLVLLGMLWVYLIGLLYVAYWGLIDLGLRLLPLHVMGLGLFWYMIYDALFLLPVLVILSSLPLLLIAVAMRRARRTISQGVWMRSVP